MTILLKFSALATAAILSVLVTSCSDFSWPWDDDDEEVAQVIGREFTDDGLLIITFDNPPGEVTANGIPAAVDDRKATWDATGWPEGIEVYVSIKWDTGDDILTLVREREPARLVNTTPPQDGELTADGQVTIRFDKPPGHVTVNDTPAIVYDTTALWTVRGLAEGQAELDIGWDTGSSTLRVHVGGSGQIRELSARLANFDPPEGGNLAADNQLTITFDKPPGIVKVNNISAWVRDTEAIWEPRGLPDGPVTLRIQWADSSDTWRGNITQPEQTCRGDWIFSDFTDTDGQLEGVWLCTERGVPITISPGLDLTGIKILEADFQRIDLSKSSLLGADLIKSDLSEAKLTDTDFTNANLAETNLSKARIHNADFSNADLRQANLANVITDFTDFSGAILIGANLSNTKLGKSDFSKADFSGADLRGTDLSMANISGAKFRGALYNAETRFPVGFDPVWMGMIKMP